MGLLIDAGPALNFLAAGQENVLIQLAKTHGLQLATCERVDREVRGMARNPRFERTAVPRKWPELTGSDHIRVLSDDLEATPGLRKQIELTSGMPAAERLKEKPSLGEILLIAHACVHALDGENVVLLIDDADGTARARQAQQRISRVERAGEFKIASTRVTLRSAEPSWLKNTDDWTKAYEQMMSYDDGLPALT